MLNLQYHWIVAVRAVAGARSIPLSILYFHTNANRLSNHFSGSLCTITSGIKTTWCTEGCQTQNSDNNFSNEAISNNRITYIL